MAEPPKLLLPKDVAAKVRRTVDRNLKAWLFGATVDALTIRLGSPSEAAVAAQNHCDLGAGKGRFRYASHRERRDLLHGQAV